jgi:hypothetical protein
MRSLYELLHPSGVVAKQRVVDNFSGDALNERWTTFSSAGSGTFAMTDTINEGFSITTSTTNDAYAEIDFNDKRQFGTSSGFISEVKRVSATSANLGVGLANTIMLTNNTSHYGWLNQTTDTNYLMVSNNDTSTRTTVDSGEPIDENWHTLSAILNATNVRGYFDGDFKTVESTDLPLIKMQPSLIIDAPSGANSKEARIRYFEAYNT